MEAIFVLLPQFFAPARPRMFSFPRDKHGFGVMNNFGERHSTMRFSVVSHMLAFSTEVRQATRYYLGGPCLADHRAQ